MASLVWSSKGQGVVILGRTAAELSFRDLVLRNFEEEGHTIASFVANTGEYGCEVNKKWALLKDSHSHAVE